MLALLARACAAQVLAFIATSTTLSHTDLNNSIWNFAQPLDHHVVNIHVQLTAGTITRPLNDQSEFGRWCMQIEKKKATAAAVSTASVSSQSSAERDSSLRREVIQQNSQNCVITNTQKPLHVCHIIPHSLAATSVIDFLQSLFGITRPVNPENGRAQTLFDCHDDSQNITTLESTPNGVTLSIPLHRCLDDDGRIWILRKQCFVIGTARCFDELHAFDPPCPSVLAHRSLQRDGARDMLWNQKVIHEDSVKPLICDIDAVQERLFHVRTLFSFFILFMRDKPIITSWSGLLGPAANNTHGADSSQGGGGKRKKLDSNRAETGSSGHDWSGTGGGSTEGGLPDQSVGSDHSHPSSSAETAISPTSSTAAKNEAKIPSESSVHLSPGVARASLKRMRTEDGSTRSESPPKERQTSPTLSSNELDAFSDSDSDSYEFSEDEEEYQARRERRRERLRLNIMALNFMMRNHRMA